jgi:hypothetical protein
MNTVVLHGHVRATPVERKLDSGDVLVSFDLVTPVDPGRTTVPVVWTSDGSCALHEGDELVVIGTVGRRFFRARGTTAWRTDVTATRILELGAGRAVRRHLDEVSAAVLGLARAGRVRSPARPRRVDDPT